MGGAGIFSLRVTLLSMSVEELKKHRYGVKDDVKDLSIKCLLEAPNLVKRELASRKAIVERVSKKG
jgi:hypothetical protein